jgi:acetyl-CoA C-acetyltransferase
MTKRVFVIDATRTPVGKFGGTLASVRPDDLAALVIRQIVERNPGIPKEAYEDIIFGAANQAGEDNRNVARMAGLMAGLPISVPGITVNRLCASSMQAVADTAKNLMLGYGNVMIAGGVESMSRAPFVMAKAETAYSRKAEVYDTSIGWRFTNPKLAEMYHPFAMGNTAENVAEQYGITRKEQDAFAHRSQERFAQANQNGKFKQEITPVEVPRRKKDPIVFDTDEHPRLSSEEVLSGLRPAFQKDGTVTAGNSSGVNDGAAALILANEDAVNEYGLTPIAEVLSSAAAGVHPDIMGIGPVPASRKALERAGLKPENVSLWEINEAFAAQAIACVRDLELDDSIVNVNGGSIAIGHPLGASGARIINTLLYEMKRRGSSYGVATMCVGVGQGMAVVFKNVQE